MNNTYSDYNEIIFDLPKSYILRSILFNLSISDLFFFIEITSVNNFSDDNTLSAWGETILKLIHTSESESSIVIDWSLKTEMIINPDKPQVIFLDRKKSNLTNISLVVDSQTSKSVAVPTENALSLVKACHRSSYNRTKTMIMSFLVFFKEILPNASIKHLLLIILRKS